MPKTTTMQHFIKSLEMMGLSQYGANEKGHYNVDELAVTVFDYNGDWTDYYFDYNGDFDHLEVWTVDREGDEPNG